MKRDMRVRLFVHATNVHLGGGWSLLYALLGVLPENLGLIALLDTRMRVPEGMSGGVQIRRVKPSILQRLKAEWWLSRNVRPGDVVLCFGNLPPLFKLRGYAIAFLQNKYLVDKVKLSGFPIKTRLRISIERLWLFWKAAHANEFIVQTPSMKALLEIKLGAIAPVRVLPFVSVNEGYARRLCQHDVQKSVRYDFVYVASGEPHKNHRQLVEAWCLLAAEGLFPSLCLTVAATVSVDLCRWIDEKKNQYGLHLENLGLIPHDQVKQLYTQAQALIYPSTFESFGLPLIEARHAGLPVLAAELDYVRDVLDTEQSFDPDSPVSIARAVKRYMGMDELPLKLLDAKKFMHCLLERLG